MAQSQSAKTALDLLVLTVLDRRGPLHGYGIASAIQELSAEALRVDEGSLYPALHRMEEAKWIAATSVVTENNRRARLYKMTRNGRKHLATETDRWNSLTTSVSRVLRLA
jgi:PadR family transcriptional regulator, regulatory protein PadR